MFQFRNPPAFKSISKISLLFSQIFNLSLSLPGKNLVFSQNILEMISIEFFIISLLGLAVKNARRQNLVSSLVVLTFSYTFSTILLWRIWI